MSTEDGNTEQESNRHHGPLRRYIDVDELDSLYAEIESLKADRERITSISDKRGEALTALYMVILQDDIEKHFAIADWQERSIAVVKEMRESARHLSAENTTLHDNNRELVRRIEGHQEAGKAEIDLWNFQRRALRNAVEGLKTKMAGRVYDKAQGYADACTEILALLPKEEGEAEL